MFNYHYELMRIENKNKEIFKNYFSLMNIVLKVIVECNIHLQKIFLKVSFIFKCNYLYFINRTFFYTCKLAM